MALIMGINTIFLFAVCFMTASIYIFIRLFFLINRYMELPRVTNVFAGIALATFVLGLLWFAVTTFIVMVSVA